MAYGYRRPYRRRRLVRRRRPTVSRRRTYGTRFTTARPYRRTYRRRKPMSTRRVLNLTSVKKKDEMQTFDPANPTATSMTLAGGTSDGIYIYVFSPTARDITDSDAPSLRNKQTVYWKGFRERIEFIANTGVNWRWRRIVVEMKNWRISSAYAEQSSGDMRRVFRPFNEDATWEVLFAGVRGTSATGDFSSLMNAHVDTRRVKLLFDKTRNMRAGNSSGHTHLYNDWYAFEKTMYYDEDEAGGAMPVSNYWSSPNPAGMGDVYVFDFIQCIEGATTDTLRLRAQSTAYWHEK